MKLLSTLTGVPLLALTLVVLNASFRLYAADIQPIGCGPISAVTLVRLLGKSADPIRNDAPEGMVSLLAVKALVEKCGVPLTGYKLTFSQVQSLKRPVIAVMNGDHAVVLDCIDEGYVRLIDNGAPRLMRRPDFEKQYSGIVLAPTSYPPPPLKVDPITCLGALAPGQSRTVAITAENVSDKPITVEFPGTGKACRSCGSAGTESRPLASGERFVIDRTFQAPRQGLLEEHLVFGVDTSYVILASIVGEVNSGFVVDPPSIDIGKVPPATEKSAKIMIRRSGSLMPALEKVTASVDWIKERKEARSASDVSLCMTFGICPAKAGSFRETVTLKVAGGLQVVVPIEGEALPYVHAVPATAVFGHIVLGSSAEWECELQGGLADKSTPGSPDMPSEMSCAFLKEGNRWKVRLVLTPKQIGLFSKEVVIRTGLSEQPELHIQALAFVKAKEDE